MARNKNTTTNNTRFRTPPPPPKPPPSSSTSNLPAYIVLPALTLTGTALYTYYLFLDEVPYTKRKRLLATSIAFEQKIGDNEYQKLLQSFGKNNILPENHRASVTVRRIGSRIANSADRFMVKYDPKKDTTTTKSNKPYTYTVIRSNQANAFVLPGNHVFVLTGLFRYAQNEDELAAVLGHEMAHNIARHAGERLSGNVLMSFLGKLLLLIDPSMTLYMMFVPAVTLLRELPHSREHEVEADRIGVMIASDACYDPRAAKRVFGSMKAGIENSNTTKTKQPSQPPEFLSTHPSYDSRLSNFDNWMPEAMDIFHQDGGMKCQQIRYEMAQARKLAAREHAWREEQQQRRKKKGEIQFGV
uniref:Peptidase M48 domain-containing protein n=1 Tax=Helicotheca tamesis TaxID=374047 RepID=A0A7S2N4G0_9STRA|mmetsp:Transcript_9250/g.12849  ORF Transcript_9250/g.12849 Transcript_9250/m.12849 type:complete len:358 (+) Transcript_9250:77-1150(+)